MIRKWDGGTDGLGIWSAGKPAPGEQREGVLTGYRVALKGIQNTTDLTTVRTAAEMGHNGFHGLHFTV